MKGLFLLSNEERTAVIASLMDAVGKDPHPDWKDSLVDAAELLQSLSSLKSVIKRGSGHDL